MIQPLRTIHRWVFSGFAVLLPAIVFIAVAERHQYVEAGQIRLEPLSSTLVISQRGQFRLGELDGRIELQATSSMPRPELLVYWSQQAADTSLPSDARLLGPYRDGNRYELPQGSTGTVLLFSPATSSVTDSILLGRPR